MSKLKVVKTGIKIAEVPVKAAEKTVSVGQKSLNVSKSAGKAATETAAPNIQTTESYVADTAEKSIVNGYHVTKKGVKKVVRTPGKTVKTVHNVKRRFKKLNGVRQSIKQSKAATKAEIKVTKTAVKESTNAVKAASRGVKTAYKTAKTAGQTARAAIRTAKPMLKAAAKAAAQVAKAVAKIAVEAVKLIGKAIVEAVVATAAAIGWPLVIIILVVIIVVGVVAGVASCNSTAKYNPDTINASIFTKYKDRYNSELDAQISAKPADCELQTDTFSPDWKEFTALCLAYTMLDGEIDNLVEMERYDDIQVDDSRKFETVYASYIPSITGVRTSRQETKKETVVENGSVIEKEKIVNIPVWHISIIHNTPESVTTDLMFTEKQRYYYNFLLNGDEDMDMTDFWDAVLGEE